MNRQEKKEVVDALKNEFTASAGSFIVSYKGLSVADLQDLRVKLRGSGGKMKVAKARLMRLAAEGLRETEGLDQYFSDQVALVFADEQPSAVAKVLYGVAKGNENLVIMGGCVENRAFDKEGVQFIASLPSRDVLLAQLAGVLSAPTTQFARLLNGMLVKLVLTLKAVEQNK